MKAPFPWYGGKKNVKDIIVAELNKVWDESSAQTYYEPFVGGGTILWELQPTKAVISDVNCYLMNLYNVIRHSLPKLLKILDKFEEAEYKNDRRFFDTNKQIFNELKNKVNLQSFNATPIPNQVMLAARFYYMCKRGFGGIVNTKRDGTIDVRFSQTKIDGRYLYDLDNMEEISQYLQTASIRMGCDDYKKVLKNVKKGSVVYLDPPYYSEVHCSDNYWEHPFGKKEHEELANEVKRLTKLGAFVLVSNSDYKYIRELYNGFRIKKLNLRRTVNMNTSKTHKEVLITNF